MELTDGRPLDGLTMVWRVKGDVVEGANSTVLDCSNLAAGAYLIALEVQTDKQITSTQAINLIRLPAADLTAMSGFPPSTSLGPETATESVGWMSIGVLALIVSIFVFLLLVRNPNLNPRTALAWPDAPSVGRRFTRYRRPSTTWTTKGRFGANILPGRWTGGTESGASGTGGSRWNSQKRC